jgi:hypothetical protein
MERFTIKLDNIDFSVVVNCGNLTFMDAFEGYDNKIIIVKLTIERDYLEHDLKNLIPEFKVIEAIKKEVYGY